jgi:hypothetical protein
MTAQSKITQQLDRISQLFHSKKPYFLPMTETPEWFQLPDSPEPEPKRPRRITLKVALITAPLLLIGGAVVFAENGNEGEDKPNLPTLSSAATSSSANATVTVAKKKNHAKVNKAITPQNSNQSNTLNGSSGLNGTNSGIKNPGLPSNKVPDHGAGLDRPKHPGDHKEHHDDGAGHVGGGEDD